MTFRMMLPLLVLVGLGAGCSGGPTWEPTSLTWDYTGQHVNKADYTEYGQKGAEWSAVRLTGRTLEDGWRLKRVDVSEDISWSVRNSRFQLKPVFVRDPSATAGPFTGYATFAFDPFYYEFNPVIYCRDLRLGPPERRQTQPGTSLPDF